MPNSLNTFKPRLFSRNKLITNLSITASTEATHTLQTNLNGIIVRARGNTELRIAFVSGETDTNYITIRKGAVLSLTGLDFPQATLYVQGDGADTVEILELYT